MTEKKKYPFVSIIIPTINRRDDLSKCLKFIRALDYPKKKLEIIIWDNGSSDGTQAEVNKIFKEMKNEEWKRLSMIQSEHNKGVYTSRDELLKRVDSKMDYVLSLDDDVFLSGDSLTILLGSLQSNPKAGIIGPRTVYESKRDETAHGAGFVNLYIGRYSESDAGALTECDYVIGCCMLIKKNIASMLDGFDRDYYTSHGEVDFCLRAKKNGYRILYEPGVVVRHNVATGGTRTPERLYYVYRNKLLVLKKNTIYPQKIFSLSFFIIFGSIKNIMQSLVRGGMSDLTETRVVLLAFFDGIMNRMGKTNRKFSE